MDAAPIVGLRPALNSPLPIFTHLGSEKHFESEMSWLTTQRNVPGQDSNSDSSIQDSAGY